MPCADPLIALLDPFRPVFTTPTWEKMLVLLRGPLLARGRRTVSLALPGSPGDPSRGKPAVGSALPNAGPAGPATGQFAAALAARSAHHARGRPGLQHAGPGAPLHPAPDNAAGPLLAGGGQASADSTPQQTHAGAAAWSRLMPALFGPGAACSAHPLAAADSGMVRPGAPHVGTRHRNGLVVPLWLDALADSVGGMLSAFLIWFRDRRKPSAA